MRVELAYGRGSLAVELPSGTDLIKPRWVDGLPDEAGALRAALREPIRSRPLRDLVRKGASIGVSVCDVTRPFPAARVLPVLLDELDADRSRVTLFVATGTHRLCTPAELESMLGRHVLARCQVIQHDAFDTGRHAGLGQVPGSRAPALVERDFLEQEVRITTGFIEPHFFAGFSGGPKMVAPGLAALETVLELHSADRIGSPNATWGVIEGNPVHDAVRAVAARAGVTFNLDVTLNRRHAVTGVFAGDLFASHSAGCDFARRTAMAPVTNPYDVVVTTNSGYPLDQNLYQAVKGMSAAAQIVREGGDIVIASECSDGFPDHGQYRSLLAAATGPDDFLQRLREPGFKVHDQWQVQVQAQIQRRARVHVKAGGLRSDELREAWFDAVDDIGGWVARLGGRRVAVLPDGPQTIPYLV